MYLIALMLILSACNPAASNLSFLTQTASANTSTKVPTPADASTPTPSPIPTTTMSPMPTRHAVTITVAKGNLFIRRGPGLAYDSISVLMDGQSANVLGRDVLEKWLQISLPDDPEKTGWISNQSHYSVVNGDVTSLPVIEPTDWPVLASVRNCTPHEMRVDPIGLIIPTAENFPWNDVTINPGIYTIHDLDAHGDPEIMEVEIKEGTEIRIREDGNGERWSCSTPE